MFNRLGTMKTSSPSGEDNFKCANAPKGIAGLAFILHCIYPAAVNNDGTHTVPVPTMKQLIAAALGSFTLSYGENNDHLPYATVPGVEVRDVNRYLLKAEMINNISTQITSTTSTGNVPVTFDIVIPFEVPAAVDGRKRLPGQSQLKTMQFEIVEGQGLSLNNSGSTVTRQSNANVQYDIDLIGIPAEEDEWVPILSFKRTNDSRLECDGPDGSIIAVWEASNAQSANPVALGSLKLNEKAITGTVPTYLFADRYEDLYAPNPNADIADSNSIFFSIDAGQSIEEAPTGQITLVQASQYLTQIQMRTLYYPGVDSLEAAEAAKLGAKTAGKPVLATMADSAAKAKSLHHAKTQPIRLLPAEHPDFTLKSGLLAENNGSEPHPTVPEHVIATMQAAVGHASISGSATVAATQSKVLENLTRSIPGMAHGAAKGGATGVAGTVQHLTGHLANKAPPKAKGTFARIFGALGIVRQ